MLKNKPDNFRMESLYYDINWILSLLIHSTTLKFSTGAKSVPGQVEIHAFPLYDSSSTLGYKRCRGNII